MGDFKDLIIPQVNVNDTKVTISDIQKEQLEYIEEDEMLYCVETSKATEDYYPEYSGYVVMFVEDLDEVEVGKSAGMIFKDLEDAKAKLAEIEAEKEKAKKLASVNASKKAIAYAEEKGVDITLIKKDGIIKTQDIDEWIANNK
jgi:pyruvate/2-oxoglutarate dehydrogenase complex dihydrolipoamide acyltransferase (E2) component